MESLLNQYRRHASDHKACTAEGDADRCNAAYGRLHDVFHALIRERKRNELFNLYEDTDPAVQLWAAVHTLEVDEARALDKLRQIEILGIPHVSTDVRYIIPEWKSGALRFFPHSENG